MSAGSVVAWLDLPQHMLASIDSIEAVIRKVHGRFDDIVVLGMGGSSLPAEIFAQIFGHTDGFPQLRILDSTHPAQIIALEAQIDPQRTLFVVASKRGATVEPNACYAYFYDRVVKAVGSKNAGTHFIAVTDPGTPLAEEARAKQFLACFENDPNISGRYSALSYFGLVPATLAGYDVRRLLERAVAVMPQQGEAAIALAAEIGAHALAGRDKLTIVAHPQIRLFGTWIEQQVAEATAKDGKGIVTIEGEPLGEPSVYDNDRLFVYIGANTNANLDGANSCHPERSAVGAKSKDQRTALEALERAGHPVVRVAVNDLADIAVQFHMWQLATIMTGLMLQQDPFSEPDVEASTLQTKALLASFDPSTSRLGRYAQDDKSELPQDGTDGAFKAGLAQIRAHDYVSTAAYIPQNEENEMLLRELRVKIRDRYKVATIVGFGPRFLHLTEQLHKGGPAASVSLQITDDVSNDVSSSTSDANVSSDAPNALQIPSEYLIPGGTLTREMNLNFATLLAAQALGDQLAREERNRRGVRIHLRGNVADGLRALVAAVV